MSKKVSYVARTTANEVSAGKGFFVQGVVTYVVMDDLVVKPMSVISSTTLLNKFNVKDLSAFEEKVVDFKMYEDLSHFSILYMSLKGPNNEEYVKDLMGRPNDEKPHYDQQKD
ncbi:hypothetical protein Acr_02g0004480 [Actinidia rufa]|uniref:Uncharacterized protein n=1 Tax=Actinidia rufa TaxID=165716 RepID=A0A7J0E6Z3_9ERIC|nr:hypothetical protein Acr_02g0004480 [Actinidia rufa]